MGVGASRTLHRNEMVCACIYSTFSSNDWPRGHAFLQIPFPNLSRESPSAMAATEKNARELEKASKLSNVPKGDQYERMISGML